MENTVLESLTVFRLPPQHRRRLRAVNMLECLSKEIRRPTTVATLFPHEASLPWFVSAVLVEVSEEWKTGRKYLNVEQEGSPHQKKQNRCCFINSCSNLEAVLPDSLRQIEEWMRRTNEGHWASLPSSAAWR